MTDLRRVHASLAQWKPKSQEGSEQEDGSDLAEFFSKLARPTDMDPPS